MTAITKQQAVGGGETRIAHHSVAALPKAKVRLKTRLTTLAAEPREQKRTERNRKEHTKFPF
jgi:hypothetical protein